MHTTKKPWTGSLLALALALPLGAGAAPAPDTRPEPDMGRGPGMCHEPNMCHESNPRREPMGPPFGHGGPGGGLPPFMRGIDLTEAQQDKVFALLHAQAPLMREQHKSIAKAHAALHALAASGAFDDAKAGALAQSVGQAMAALTLQQAKSEQQLLALLTPAQRQQVEQSERDGPRRGPHRDAPPRPQ